MSLWRWEDINIKRHLVFIDRSWLNDPSDEGPTLADKEHKYWDAPKLRDQFSVNHDRIQDINYQVLMKNFSKMC